MRTRVRLERQASLSVGHCIDLTRSVHGAKVHGGLLLRARSNLCGVADAYLIPLGPWNDAVDGWPALETLGTGSGAQPLGRFPRGSPPFPYAALAPTETFSKSP